MVVADIPQSPGARILEGVFCTKACGDKVLGCFCGPPTSEFVMPEWGTALTGSGAADPQFSDVFISHKQ